MPVFLSRVKAVITQRCLKTKFHGENPYIVLKLIVRRSCGQGRISLMLLEEKILNGEGNKENVVEKEKRKN
jgi:hypothetical protein